AAAKPRTWLRHSPPPSSAAVSTRRLRRNSSPHFPQFPKEPFSTDSRLHASLGTTHSVLTSLMPKPSLLALAVLPAALAAHQAPPGRLIAAPDASTKPVLSIAAAVRQLPNGGVLVNDILKRQLVLFDNTLTNATIVADSVSGGANSYGVRPGGIIP